MTKHSNMGVLGVIAFTKCKTNANYYDVPIRRDSYFITLF